MSIIFKGLKGISKILFAASLFCFVGAIASQFLTDRKEKSEVEWTSEIQESIGEQVAAIQTEITEIVKSEAFSTDLWKLSKNKSFIFIYENGSLKYWNDNLFIPEYKNIAGEFDIKFIRTVRNDYIAVKERVNRKEIVGIVPIYNDYKIDNQYISTGFNRDIFYNQNLTLLRSEDSEHKICIGENCLFGIEFLNGYTSDRHFADALIFSLYFIAILLFIIATLLTSLLIGRTVFIKGFGFLMISLVVLRYAMIYFEVPGSLIDNDIFDSKVFASSSFNASFADLFLNIVLFNVICYFLLSRFRFSKTYRIIIQWSMSEKIALSIVLLGLFTFLYHSLYLIFQTIYHNSQISFDINETILFDGPRITAFVIFLLFASSIFLLGHLFFRISNRLIADKRLFTICFFAGGVLFTAINLIIGQTFIPTLMVAVILFVVLLITNLTASLSKLRYATFLYFFSVVFATGLLGAVAIFNFENEREIDRKKKFASQFLLENDHMAEFLLAEVNDKIKNDVFIQSRMASPFLSKDIVESKIRQVYLNSYFDKYDVRIYLYNANGDTFIEGIEQPVQIKKLKLENYKTGYDGIYFINKLDGSAAKRYLDYIEIKKRGIKVGYVLMDMRLKRIIPDNVYPELLVDNRFLVPYQNSNYSYAVFEGDEITFSSGDFNYRAEFGDEVFSNESTNVSFQGYRHVIIKDQAGRNIVISSSDHPISDVIGNFSFLFLLQVFFVLIFTAIYTLYYAYRKIGLNYSTRIQLYLNVAFFLPLFAVSITTLSLINASFEKEVIDEYFKKAESVGNNLNGILEEYISQIADEDELKERVGEISKYSGTDINIFDTEGRLLQSSQPIIYENGLISKYANPHAFQHIVKARERSFTTNENVGSLNYNATYFGVKSFDTGELIGMVSIPFFQSEYALEQSQISVVTSILNIFTGVFIIFLIISYFTAKWLTFPLAFITQKLKKTTLTEFNEPLIWHADDEIGLMVGEYNRMLVNLEDSKVALAKSEKQSAWREIAQQVAHEIKNPLTPMKLTLQHLSRKLLDSDNDQEKARPINMLLKQIETLDDIASSFSSFAKMPIPESERYEFTEVLKNVVNLHSSTEGVNISLQLPHEKVFTLGDEQLMGRILSNLILNAIQAKTGTVTIDIALSVTRDKLLLQVKDDGPGIDEDIQSKIFIPNFTTKETGSGIGLAISKHGVEHAGGKIWFESLEDQGTTFFIELPTIHE